MKKLKLKEFEKLVEHIGEEKKLIARGLIEELAFMQSALQKLKAVVKKEGELCNAMKIYNQTVQRYGNLYKQLEFLLRKEEPKPLQPLRPPQPENDTPEGEESLAAWLVATE